MSKVRSLLLVSAMLGLITMLLPSCLDTKSVIYFNNLPDTQRIELKNIIPPQPLIQINDLLEVRIGGENEKTVQYISQYLGGSAPTSTMTYTVDVNGNIELPKIGKVRVEGLTRDQARDTIASLYSEYLLNPIVTVKFGNFRFVVLGEVKSPGYYLVSNERINIFEAMAQAGDMTQYAQRDHVKIIRDNNGKREVIQLNFNDRNILNSPYYYLIRNDMIYVEPRSIKLATENFSRTTAYIATATSIVALLFALFRR